MLLTVGMAVKTVAEAVAVVMALAWPSRAVPARTSTQSPLPPPKQATNQTSEMTTTYIDATLAWKSAALLGSIPESIREQPRSCIAHHHKFVAAPDLLLAHQCAEHDHKTPHTTPGLTQPQQGTD